MKISVLMDNIGQGDFCGEWGLAIHIAGQGGNILLDTGASGAFLQNAALLRIDAGKVDFGVLSHAHYDHANGLEDFFAANERAPFYLRSCCGENCYSEKETGLEYIGIKEGWLEKYRARLKGVEKAMSPAEGVRILPHTTEGLAELGRRAKMFVKEDGALRDDDFAHEQTLVVEAESGLVIFNSCSHGGADNIINEVKAAYPGRRVYAYIGGLHLFRSSADEVRALAERMLETGIERVITGHCTGEEAFAVLREVMGERVEQMYAGMELEID